MECCEDEIKNLESQSPLLKRSSSVIPKSKSPAKHKHINPKPFSHKNERSTSRVLDTTQKVKIRLAILGKGQVHGEGDVVLCRNYTTTLKCIERGSEAFVMNREDFLRLFKTNEESWRIMFDGAKSREQQVYHACLNFVHVCNESHKIRSTPLHSHVSLNWGEVPYTPQERIKMGAELDSRLVYRKHGERFNEREVREFEEGFNKVYESMPGDDGGLKWSGDILERI
jgi:hypothetical protein